MNNTLDVLAKSVYGTVLLYPVNDQAVMLARIVGTKTLSRKVLGEARAMGFVINVTGDAAVKAQEWFR